MKEQRYLTVAEFSKASNKTKQELYSIIREEKYKSFVITEDGVKKISIELLDLISGKKKADTSQEKHSSPQNSPEQANNAEVDKLHEEIKRLNAAILERDRTIQEKDKMIADYATKFADMAQQALIIAGQAQVLQASSTKLQLTEQASPEVEEINEEEKVKRNFLARLFRRG